MKIKAARTHPATTFFVMAALRSSDPTRPSLLGHEHRQVGLVVGEPRPRLFELPHAVGAVGAAALSPVRPHGDHGIDAPGPMLGDATAVLNADGADLDIQAVIFEDDAVVVVRLWMNDFAEVQIHLVRYQKSVSKRELAGQ